jgi:hypothetical protein
MAQSVERRTAGWTTGFDPWKEERVAIALHFVFSEREPPIWILGALSNGLGGGWGGGLDINLTSYFHPVLSSGLTELCLHSHPSPCTSAQGQSAAGVRML